MSEFPPFLQKRDKINEGQETGECNSNDFMRHLSKIRSWNTDIQRSNSLVMHLQNDGKNSHTKLR